MAASCLSRRWAAVLLLLATVVCIEGQLDGQLIDFYPSAMATALSSTRPQWAIKGSSERDVDACYFSKSVTDPWWKLDLTIVRGIFNVRVVAATSPVLLDGLVVYVSNATTVGGSERVQCGDALTSGSGVDVTTFTCNGTLVGQYVYITTSTTSTGILALCEVMLNVQTGSGVALDFSSIQAEVVQGPGDDGSRTADLAIDGDASSVQAQCASTTSGSNPFLRIDLKRPRLVTKVDIKFYDDGGNGAIVEVGGNLIAAGNYQCGSTLSYQSNSGNFYSFSCSESQLGQYVIVTIAGTAQLQMCEVQVFTDSLLDIYLPGSVTASSQLSANWEIWKAVDRFHSTSNKQCYRSVRGQEDYWRLELISVTTISMVKITSHARDDFRDDLLGSRVFIGNTTTNKGKDNVLCGAVTSTAVTSGVLIYIQCASKAVGKYIYIITTTGSTRSLYLCEVELYSPGVPEVTVQPQSQQVSPGVNISLDCSAAGTPQPSLLTWKLDNVVVNGTDIQTSNSTPSEIEIMSTLTITKVERSRGGRYTCEATNSEGTTVSDVAVVTVLYAPVVAAVQPSVVVLRGSNATLQVTVSGASPDVPNINGSRTWSGPSGTVIMADSKFSFSSDRYTLTVSGVDDNDTGRYIFTAANSVGQDSVTISLTIQVTAPTVTAGQPSVVALKGSTAILQVTVSGASPDVPNTSANRTWSGPSGSVIMADSKFSFSSDLYTLTVGEVNFNDTGSYTFIAANSVGKDSVPITLTVEAAPLVTSQPKELTVNANQLATFSCVITGHPEPTITWERDGNTLSDGGRIQISETGSATSGRMTSLMVTSTVVGDAGNYVCKANNSRGNTTSNTVNLVVQVMPSVGAVSSFVVVREGSNATLQVNIMTAIPLVANSTSSRQWQFSNGSVVTADSRFSFSSDRLALSISVVTLTDGGIYTFQATNAAGSGTATVTLTVTEGTPVIERPPSNAQVNAGDTVMFSCNASAYPQPVFTWRLDFTDLTAGGNTSISSVVGNDPYTSTLTLNNVEAASAGDYSCTATNRRGSDTSQTATLTVYVKPTVTAVNTMVAGSVGGSVVLQVTVSGANPVVISQGKVWKKGSDELTSKTKYSFSNNRLTLNINTLTVSDGGSYTFTASNRAGSGTATIKVIVQGFPIITQQPMFDTVNETGTLVVTCKASASGADPKPTSFKWDRGGTQLTSGGRRSVTTSTAADGELTGTLQIQTVTTADDGNYKCTAVSSAGETSSDAMAVRVQVAPQISVSNAMYSALESAVETEFVLTIVNAPQVYPSVTENDIVWKHEGNVISTSDGYRFSSFSERLHVKVREQFAGSYSVEVANAAGRAMATFQISILVPVRIEQFLSNTTVNETDSFTLNCTAHGVPTPTVNLYLVKDGGDELLQNQLTVPGNAFNGDPYIAYTVVSSQGSHSGQYKCVGQNDVRLGAFADIRTSNSTAQVTINVAAKITFPTQPIAAFVIEGNVLLLHCSATGTPTPTYSWTLDGQNVDVSRAGYSLAMNGTLLVQMAHLVDAGVYVCTARNLLHSPKSEAQTVTVRVEPQIEFPLRSFTINFTTPMNISIDCSAVGIPQPVVAWQFGDTGGIVRDDGVKYSLISDVERHSNKDVFEVARNLTILTPVTNDTRPYICSATSPEFSAVVVKRTIHVIVLVAPTFVSSPKNTTLMQTTQAVLQCSASAAPVPSIEWRKNGTVLPSNNRYVISSSSVATSNIEGRPFITSSTLTIADSIYTDAGVYSCHSINAIDEVTSNVATLVVEVPPAISSHPVSQTRNMSDSVTFSCASAGVPAPNITWNTTGQAVISNATANNVVSGSDSTLYTTRSELTVSNLQKSYDGNFSCTASNGVGSPATSNPATLTVQVKPTLVAVNKSLIGVEYLSLTLSVYILDAFPDVKAGNIVWTNSSNDMPFSTSTDLSSSVPFYQSHDAVNNVATLVVKNVSLDSDGGYRCTARNEAGSGSAVISIVTEGPPKLVERPRDTNVVVGETVNLKCETSSIPVADFVWTKGGVIVSNGSMSRFSLSQLTPSEGILVITTVTYGDRGEYRCTASNKHGTVAATAMLAVQVPPTISSPPTQQTTVEPGMTIFKCVASGQPMPTISWKRTLTGSRTDEQLTSGGKFTIQADNSLVITETLYEDTGMYICVASNNLAEMRMADSSAQLAVNVHPNITASPQDVTVVSPDNVTLQCEAQGFPLPLLTWQHGGQSIVTSEPKLNVQSNQFPSDIRVTSTLLVRTSIFGDRGVYKCVVNNLVGQDEADAVVTVQYVPAIIVAPIAKNVRKPDAEFLFCQAEGFPRPSIQWQKDNNASLPTTYRFEEEEGANQNGLPTLSSNLTLTQTQTSDTGDFTCVVTNDVDTKTKSAQLTVLEVPFMPTDVAITSRTKDSVSLSWKEPFDGNDHISGYFIQYSGGIPKVVGWSSPPIDTRGSGLSYTVGGLHPYANYTFRVSAKNEIGTGGYSDSSPLAETEEDVPGPPPDISTVAESSRSIRVQWSEVPFEEQNGIITRYQVEIRERIGPSNLEFPVYKTATERGTYLATALKPFTYYQFQVRAYTIVGPGMFSPSDVERTDEDKPSDPPSILEAKDQNSTTVALTWMAPRIPNGIIRYYTVNWVKRTDPSVNGFVQTSTNITEATVGGLEFYTEYSFTVRAFTVGYSDYSEVKIARSGEHPPGKPLNVSFDMAKTSETSLTVQWKPPNNPYGIIRRYKVRLMATKTYTVDGMSVTIDLNPSTYIDNQTLTAEFDNLTPYTEYTAYVQGKTNALGEDSDPTALRTHPSKPVPVQPPAPPPTGLPETTSSFSVYLYRGSTRNGPISHYQLIVLRLTQNATERAMGLRPHRPTKLPSSYGRDDLVTYTAAQQPADPVAYITAEFDYNLFPSDNIFNVGRSDEPNDNGQYTNGALNAGSFYTTFLRSFTDTRQSRRKRVPLNVRQYDVYSSSDWGPVTQTATESSSTSVGAVAGAVVAVVIVAIIVLVILILYLRKRRRDAEKIYVTESDFALRDSMEDLTGEVPRVGTPTIRLRHLSTVKRNPAAVTYEGPAPVPVSQFADHVARMHANGNYTFKQEYEAIQKQSPKHQSEVGSREQNKPKNRYANISCFDHSRVKLPELEGEEGSDYINANFLDGYRRQQAYIASQGVVPATVDDFWRMIWSMNSKTIVMITKLKEQGRDKCHKYWPNKEQSETYTTLTVKNVDEVELSDHVVRTFELLSDTRETRTVKQFHFTMWPDHGVPQFFSPLLAFLQRVRSYNPRDDPAGPMVVHCSAGVGRTGTFIVIDTQLQNAKSEKSVDIYNFVTRIREQRNFMVQTEDQYVFVHDAVLEALLSGNTEVSSQNLRRYVEDLKATDHDTDQNGFEKQFKQLANSRERANASHYKSANLDANKKKNRMVNILPYDSSRVCLQISPGVEGSDYVNASFIDGYQLRHAFIAAQGPIQETVPDFWRMLWEKNSNTVVMITKLVEKGQERCAQYWPTTQAGRFGVLLVTLERETPCEGYTMREFTVMNTKESLSRTVTQFHYTAWPDSGVPASGAGILDLIGQVQRTQQQSGNGPITVHDSTGVGRTGTFIVLSICVERLKAENVVDVFQTVKLLRTQRPFMVQTTGQLTFCYKTIIEYLDSFDIYSNFK